MPYWFSICSSAISRRRRPPYIEPARLARYAAVTMESASGEGAQGLGWYAYNSCQFDVARFWFERAVAWFPKEATVYGYVLTLRRLRKHKEALELLTGLPEQKKQRAIIDFDKNFQRATGAPVRLGQAWCAS